MGTSCYCYSIHGWPCPGFQTGVVYNSVTVNRLGKARCRNYWLRITWLWRLSVVIGLCKKEEDTYAPSEDFLYGKVSEDSVPSDKMIVTWNVEPSPEGLYLWQKGNERGLNCQHRAVSQVGHSKVAFCLCCLSDAVLQPWVHRQCSLPFHLSLSCTYDYNSH